MLGVPPNFLTFRCLLVLQIFLHDLIGRAIAGIAETSQGNNCSGVENVAGNGVPNHIHESAPFGCFLAETE